MKRETTIRLSKSCIGDAEKSAVLRVLEHEFLGMGTEVQNFESELTNFFGRPAVCVANGTAALQLALQAVGLNNGDEVLVQSLTYVASFQAISATGAKPIACDVDPLTLCIDLADAQTKLTENTKAIMPVHYGGAVGDLDGIYAFAKKNRLRVIEDAAHAFGSYHKSVKVGAVGDIACFSFDGIKNITSGEGGCIVTNDKKVLEKLRDIRLLGVQKDTDKRYKGKRSWEFDVLDQGWRYHMSNIMAAIGIKQLERFSELSEKRQAIAQYYDKLFHDIKTITTFNRDYTKVVPHIYVILLNDPDIRSEIQQKLEDIGIQTGIHYYPNHKLSVYKSINFEISNVDAIFPRLLTLPLHPDLSFRDVEYVAQNLIKELS